MSDGSEVERVKTLHRRKAQAGELARPANTWPSADAALNDAPFAIDEFELGEAQKIAGMVEFLAGRLGGDFVILLMPF